MNRQLSTDSAIERSADDLLGRAAPAGQLAERLLESPGRVAFALEGQWGSGKTSFLRMVEEALAELDEQSVVIRFNPWLIRGSDELLASFLHELFHSLGETSEDEKRGELKKRFETFSSLLSPVKYLPTVGSWLSWVPLLLGKKAKDLDGCVSLEATRKELAECLRDSDLKIIVLVDDLDRLMPEEAVEMVRLIKGVFDLPRVTYLLAYDPEYLGGVLESAGLQRGRRYLEKLVQTRMSVPELSPSQVGHLLEREVPFGAVEGGGHLVAEEDGRKALLFHHVRKLLRTPRQVCRLGNRIKVALPVLTGEVQPLELVAIEVLGVAAPELYEHILCNPTCYVGAMPEDLPLLEKDQDLVDSGDAARQRIFETLESQIEIKKAVRALLCALFPRIGNNTAVHHNRASGRFAAPENLRLLAQFSLSVGQAPASRVSDFLATGTVPSGLDDSDLLEDFVGLLRDAFEGGRKIDRGILRPILEALSGIAESSQVAAMDKQPRWFRPRMVPLIGHVGRRTILASEPKLTSVELADLVLRKNLFPVVAEVLEEECSEAGLFGLNAKGLIHSCFEDKELEGVTRSWCAKAGQWMREPEFLSSSNARTAFRLIFAVDPSTAGRLMASLLNSGARAEPALGLLGSYGWTGGGRQYVQVTAETLEMLSSRAAAVDRAGAFLKDPTGLSDELWAVCSAVLKPDEKVFLADRDSGSSPR